MGYDVQTAGKENDSKNYQTGLIAFKKSMFKQIYFDSVNYEAFFEKYRKAALEIFNHEIDYKYQFAIVLEHLETGAPLVVTCSHFHHTP